MKIVIEIPEEIYKSIQDNDYCGILNSDMYNAVKNGTPLPKNHGRLKDVDWIDDNCENHYSDKDGSWCYAWRDIDNAPTIIPADKEEEETYDWCKGCKEYDTQKHCCHRYSSFIRESLQENINAVLEDIKKTLQEMADNIGEDKGLECAIEVVEDYVEKMKGGV